LENGAGRGKEIKKSPGKKKRAVVGTINQLHALSSN
jgi:hypothetical protein